MHPVGGRPRAGLCVDPSTGPAASGPRGRPGREADTGSGQSRTGRSPSACEPPSGGFRFGFFRVSSPWSEAVPAPRQGSPDSRCVPVTGIRKRPEGGSPRLPSRAPFSRPLIFLGNTCLGPPVPSWVAAWSLRPPQPHSLSLSLSSHLSVPTPHHCLPSSPPGPRPTILPSGIPDAPVSRGRGVRAIKSPAAAGGPACARAERCLPMPLRLVDLSFINSG